MSEEEMIKNIKDVIYTDTGERMNYIDIDNLTTDNECDTLKKLDLSAEEFEDIFGNVPFKDLPKIMKYIQENYVDKDKIRELKEFYIKEWKNKNITLVPLENLIKNINILLEQTNE